MLFQSLSVTTNGYTPSLNFIFRSVAQSALCERTNCALLRNNSFTCHTCAFHGGRGGMSLPNHTRSGWLALSATPDSPLKPMCPPGHPLLRRLALDQQLRTPIMRRPPIRAVSLAFLAPFADAQRHAATSVRSMAPRFATRAAPIVSRVPTVGAVHMSSPARAGTRVVTTRTRAGGTTVRVTRPANIANHRPADNNNNNNEDPGFSQDLPAPGLGFDETHVVATRGRRAGEHRRNRFDSGFFPFFDGGFILPTPVPVEQAPPNETQEEMTSPDTQERAHRERPHES